VSPTKPTVAELPGGRSRPAAAELSGKRLRARPSASHPSHTARFSADYSTNSSDAWLAPTDGGSSRAAPVAARLGGAGGSSGWPASARSARGRAGFSSTLFMSGRLGGADSLQTRLPSAAVTSSAVPVGWRTFPRDPSWSSSAPTPPARITVAVKRPAAHAAYGDLLSAASLAFAGDQNRAPKTTSHDARRQVQRFGDFDQGHARPGEPPEGRPYPAKS